MKNAQRDANTVRWSKAGQEFCPAADPFPGDSQNLICWRMVTAFIHKPSLVRIDASNFELSWQQTHKHTHKHTNRHDRLQYTAPHAASAQCKKIPAIAYHSRLALRKLCLTSWLAYMTPLRA